MFEERVSDDADDVETEFAAAGSRSAFHTQYAVAAVFSIGIAVFTCMAAALGMRCCK
jgi:hypothetical protein